jgi:outer membrane protein assembly factor BamB
VSLLPRPTGARRRLVIYIALALGLASPWALSHWRPWEFSPVVWKLRTGGEILGGAATTEGRIFFASGDQILRCLAWPSREVRWTAAVPGPPGSAPLFDPTSDLLFLTTQHGQLLAFSAETGAMLWMRSMPTARFRATPACDAATVYLGAKDGWVYALEKTTGRNRWQFFTGAPIQRGPALADGALFVGTMLGDLFALDAATGAERWVFHTEGAIHAQPAARDGVVYVGSHDKHLYAIDAATGRLLWRAHAFHEVTSTPAIAGDRVVFGAWDHHLQCVDRATGHLIWRFKADDVIEGSPLIVADTVYFGSWDCGIYAVDLETGALRWRQQTGSWVTATPVLAPEGQMVLVGGEDSVMYGLELFGLTPGARRPG